MSIFRGLKWENRRVSMVFNCGAVSPWKGKDQESLWDSFIGKVRCYSKSKKQSQHGDHKSKKQSQHGDNKSKKQSQHGDDKPPVIDYSYPPREDGDASVDKCKDIQKHYQPVVDWYESKSKTGTKKLCPWGYFGPFLLNNTEEVRENACKEVQDRNLHLIDDYTLDPVKKIRIRSANIFYPDKGDFKLSTDAGRNGDSIGLAAILTDSQGELVDLDFDGFDDLDEPLLQQSDIEQMAAIMGLTFIKQGPYKNCNIHLETDAMCVKVIGESGTITSDRGRHIKIARELQRAVKKLEDSSGCKVRFHHITHDENIVPHYAAKAAAKGKSRENIVSVVKDQLRILKEKFFLLLPPYWVPNKKANENSAEKADEKAKAEQNANEKAHKKSDNEKTEPNSDLG